MAANRKRSRKQCNEIVCHKGQCKPAATNCEKIQKLKTANETLTCMTADTHGNFPDRQCLANQENDASNPQHA
jgi:hypothetical protein